MSNKTPKVEETVEQAAETTVEPVQLTVKDLQGLAAVIDLASQRGAYRAAEMSQVGSIYGKLTAFLDELAAIQEAQAEAEAEAKEDSSE